MPGETAHISIDGRDVTYRIRQTRSSRGPRIRVGAGGVEVLAPATSAAETDLTQFLLNHSPWLIRQLDRVDRLEAARRPRCLGEGEILFRGRPTRVSAEVSFTARRDRVNSTEGRIEVTLASKGRRDAASVLERALRAEARSDIDRQVATFSRQLSVNPGRLYIMEQQTKWGNCSRRGNLSFNWRLIMAPPEVLTYLVAHETLHLAIPDHSHRFWLALQSIDPEADRSRQWLAANGALIKADLGPVLAKSTDRPGPRHKDEDSGWSP